jgi:hypothetical protein
VGEAFDRLVRFPTPDSQEAAEDEEYQERVLVDYISGVGYR